VPLSRRLAWVLQPPLELLLQHDGPVDWPAPLLPYQLQGVATLHSRHSLLLADDMGLGKTIQALAALRLLVLQRRVTNALIVVPAGLVTQWREEFRRWAPELRLSVVYGSAAERAWQWRAPAHAYLTSYESLRSDAGSGLHSPASRDWDLVILDEAQKIKNADADISRLCKRLRRTRQWALTGTPLENSPDDLLSILDFVDPTGRRERRGPLSAAELRLHLARVQLRRRKAEVLDQLPPKIVSRVTLQLAPRQRETYDRVERAGVVELREQGTAARVEHVLDLIQRLKAICNICPESGESSKLADLRERIETLAGEGHRALIFSQFTNESFGARAIAARLGRPALVYSGDLSPTRREEILRRFREDQDYVALTLSLRAGGQGLNLQEASYVFHFDRWWNPAVEQQAEARSHRLGQEQPVHVYSYTCAGTIEERIERVLAAKRNLFDTLVDDVSLDSAAHLTSDDLFGLFEE
jgi:SNF2 family DNA or RNA helicase